MKLTDRMKLNHTRVTIGACILLAFGLGYAFGQGEANSVVLYRQKEQIAQQVCHRSATPECNALRSSLPEWPGK